MGPGLIRCSVINMFLVNASIMLLLKMYNTSIMLIHILPEIKKLKLISITFLAKNVFEINGSKKISSKNVIGKLLGGIWKYLEVLKKLH